MAIFVIVHGAWSGAHAWRWVRPLLRADGHDVFTPSLTGLGERAHLATPEVDLDTHVRDVVGTLECEDLRDVILVGHSYGGPVITGAADLVPSRIGHLVYLDAEVPQDGQAEIDLLSPDERSGYESSARVHGEGWRIPPPLPDPLPSGVDPNVHWVLTRMVPQPLRTFTQPLRLTTDAVHVRRTYVLHTEGKEDSDLPDHVERIRASGDWDFVEFPAGHAAHVTAPRQLASLLASLA
jgi:pimeloyl-ACP methyl ester carboxylesterase